MSLSAAAGGWAGLTMKVSRGSPVGMLTGHQPDAESRPLGCLCQIAGASVGFLLATIVSFEILPEVPPEASKTLREARGVYAASLGFGGFIIGWLASLWVGKILSRRFARHREKVEHLRE